MKIETDSPPYLYFLIPLALLISAFWNSMYHPTTIYCLAGTSVLLAIFSIGKQQRHHLLLKLFILGFAGLSLMSLYESQASNLGHLEILLDLSIVTIFISLLSNTRWHQLFFNTIAVVIGIEGIMTISQYLTRIEPRAAGTFLNPEVASEYFPNALGLFLAMSIPLLWISQKKTLNMLQLLMTTIGVLGLLLTFSRGAIISFSIPSALLILAFLFYKHYQKVLSILLAIGISITCFYGLNGLRQDQQLETNNIQEKAAFEGSERSTSVNERVQFITGSLKMMTDQPLFGFGPSTFVQTYPQYQPTLLATSSHPHNWALKIGVERGPLTLILLLSFLGACIFTAFQGFKEKTTIGKLTLITIFASLLAGALHNSIDFNLNFGLNSLLLFLILAAFVQQSPATQKKRRISIFALASAILVIISIKQVYPLEQMLSEAHQSIAEENTTQAIELLESLSEPYQDSHPLLAELYISQEQPEKALATLEAYHEINQLDASSHNYQGAILLNQGEQEQAVIAFKEALDRDPKNFLSYYNGFYQTLNQLENVQKIETDQPSVLQLLQDYLPLAEQNIHYTAQKNNIREAIFLSHLFASLPGQTNKETFDSFTEQFYTIAMSHIPEEEQCTLVAMLNLECSLQFPD